MARATWLNTSYCTCTQSLTSDLPEKERTATMTTDTLDDLLDKVSQMDDKHFGRLLNAYLSLETHTQREMVIGLAETLSSETNDTKLH